MAAYVNNSTILNLLHFRLIICIVYNYNNLLTTYIRQSDLNKILAPDVFDYGVLNRKVGTVPRKFDKYLRTINPPRHFFRNDKSCLFLPALWNYYKNTLHLRGRIMFWKLCLTNRGFSKYMHQTFSITSNNGWANKFCKA